MEEVSGIFCCDEFAIDISLHVYKNSLTAFLLTRAFFLGAIPSDDQIRLTPSMTNKKGKVFKVYFDEQLIHCLVTFGSDGLIVAAIVAASNKTVACIVLILQLTITSIRQYEIENRGQFLWSK